MTLDAALEPVKILASYKAAVTWNAIFRGMNKWELALRESDKAAELYRQLEEILTTTSPLPTTNRTLAELVDELICDAMEYGAAPDDKRQGKETDVKASRNALLAYQPPVQVSRSGAMEEFTEALDDLLHEEHIYQTSQTWLPEGQDERFDKKRVRVIALLTASLTQNQTQH